MPLKDWDIQINYGIKTGCNEAFIIDGTTKDRLIAEDPKSAEIIRPILRGRDIKRYSYTFADKWIIATFPSRHYDIDNYPAIKNWLTSATWSNEIPDGCGKFKLEQTGETYIINGAKIKARKKTGNKWFETQDQIGYWDDFSKKKVVYPEITKYLPFFIDDDRFYVNNKGFIMVAPHPYFLTAFLNSSLFKFCYIDSFPEPPLGGRELRKVFLEQIPVLQVSGEVEEKFEQIVSEIQCLRLNANGTLELEMQLDQEIFTAYGLSELEKRAVGFIEIR
ncbi:MAG: hypothetical protein LBJ48_02815 [Coriobacteriales bacterium]|nr:hypothetical protein [Coriobacteriales bacterium]